MNNTIRQELYEYIKDLWVVDGHERLTTEEYALAQPVDFSWLFSHYCTLDLLSAGMPQADYDAFFAPDTPLERKWELFAPYWPRIEDCGYSRTVKLVMEHDYGIEELNARTYQTLTERMIARRRPGYYETQLNESKIRVALNNADSPEGILSGMYFRESTDRLKAVVRVPGSITSQGMRSEGFFESGVRSLSDLDERAAQFVQKVHDIGGASIKIMTGYTYTGVDTQAAKNELERLLRAGKENTDSEVLYWYVLERIMAEAEKFDLPFSAHTGYWGDFRAMSPEKYIYVADTHPKNRFDIFHLGYPYVKSALMLSKTRPNVFLNMCWVHDISPTLAFEAIGQIVDFLPLNKVFGFGGDYFKIEMLYGHREMMNRTLSRALAAKVDDGTLTPARAFVWAKAMLQDNPAAFYRV